VLAVAEELVARDLGRVMLVCEERAEDAIRQAQAPADTAVVLSDAERERALELLSAPDLVDRIARDFAAAGMVGERANCLVGYLAAVSRKLDRPLAVIVQSTSAAGKSALQDAVLGFVPDEERVSFSAMTGQSLFYMGESDLAHKVLAVSEEEGAERASYALNAAVGGGVVDRVDREGRHDRPAGDAHLSRSRAGRDLPDDDRGRRRRGAAEPLPGAVGR